MLTCQPPPPRLPADIYTYVSGLPSVDPRKVVVWGMSFGGAVTATCAAVDRRPKAVVLVCPLFHYVKPERADKAFAQIIKDRVSQLRGNEAYELPPFNAKGDNPIGMPGGVEGYNLMNAAMDAGHPTFRGRISLQTYQKLALFRPKEYVEMIKSPVMMVVPELDTVSPPEEQRETLARVKAPKREYFARGKDHMNVATGEGSKEMVAATVAFFRDALEGNM